MTSKYERERLAQRGAYVGESDPRYVVNFKRRKEPPKVQHLRTMKKVVRKKGKKRITYYKEKKSFWDKLFE